MRFAAILLLAFLADQPLNVRLGYPADSKLLIINADDLAMSHSENDASFTGLDQKVVTSANFLIDAESNLRAALQGFASPNSQSAPESRP